MKCLLDRIRARVNMDNGSGELVSKVIITKLAFDEAL